MSTSVENQVVRLRLENEEFERGVKRSLQSAEKLEKGLNFEGAGKGLDQLDGKISKMNPTFRSVGQTIESFSVKAIAKFQLVSKAVDGVTRGAEKLIKSLTVDNISSGWGKYAEQTSSIQTIMAATGKSIDEVTVSMDKLSWFTDETSYNLVDMTNNIGKFTSNGIKLENAVTAMIGIADAAGLAGSGVQKASHAMEGFSKAIGAGKFDRQNWSWIETAGMATKQFKESAIEAGVALGTLKKQGDQYYATAKGFEKATKFTYQTFEQSLSDAWFTSDVIMKTLEQFGGFTEQLYSAVNKTGLTASELLTYIEQYKNGTLDLANVSKETSMTVEELTGMFDELSSKVNEVGEKALRSSQEAKTFQEALDSVKDAVSTKWSKTWELIFGNYEEAKKLWTAVANELYDLFASGGDTRNEILEEWKEMGGRKDLIEGLVNVYANLKVVLDSVGRAFRSVFPAMTSSKLLDMTRKFKDITRQFAITDAQADKLQRTAKGVFSIFELGITIVKKLVSAFTSLVGGVLDDLDIDLLDITANLGDMLVGFSEWAKEVDVLDTAMSAIGTGIRGVAVVIKLLVSEFVRLANSEGVIGAFVRLAKAGFEDLVTLGGRMLDGVKEVIDNLSKLDKITLEDVRREVTKFFKTFTEGPSNIGSFFENTKKSFRNAIDQMLVKIKEFLDKVPQLKYAIVGVFTFLDNFLKNFDFGSLMVIALSASMMKFMKALGTFLEGLDIFLKGLIETIKSMTAFRDAILGIFQGTKKILDQVSNTLVSFQKYINAKRLIQIATAIAILAGSIAVLALIGPEKVIPVTVALGALAAALATITGVLSAVMAKLNPVDMAKFTSMILGITGAMIGLSTSLMMLSTIKFDSSLLSAIIGLAAVTGAMGVLIKVMSKNAIVSISGASMMVAMAAACYTMGLTFVKLSKLKFEQAVSGILALAGVVAALIILANKTKLVSAKAFLGLLPAALSLIGFGMALKVLSTVNQEKVISNLGTIAIAVGMMGAIAQLTANVSPNVGKAGAAILALSVSLVIMGSAVKKLSKISSKELAAASGAILAFMGLFTIFTAVLSTFAGEKVGKAGLAILALAAGVDIISIAVAGLSVLKKDKLDNAVLAISEIMGMMAIVVAASGLSKDAKATLIAISTAMTTLALLTGAISLMDPERAAVGTKVVMALSACLALIVGMTYFVKQANVTIAILAAVMAGLAGIVYMLGSSGMDVARANGAVEAIDKLIIGLTVMGGLTEKLGMVNMGLIANGLKNVGIILAAIAGVVVVLSAIEAVVNAIAGNGALENFLDKGVTVITTLGEAIGGFFGGIVGGAVAAFNDITTSNLTAVADRLTEFMQHLEPFFAYAEKFADIGDGETLSGFDKAASIVSMLSDIIDVATKYADIGSLETIGSQMVSFGFDLVAYSNSMANFRTEAVEKTTEALGMVMELANSAPRLGGIFETFKGHLRMDVLGEQLSAFAKQMVLYSGWMLLFKPEAVTNSSAAIGMVIDLANKAPRFSNLDKYFGGELDMDRLGEQLKKFAFHMATYSGWMSLFNADAVTKSSLAMQSVITLANSAPKFSMFKEYFSGQIDMQQLGGQLSAFARSMVAYSDAITGANGGNGFNADAVSKTTDAITAIVMLTKYLPESLSLWSKVFGGGQVSLRDFGSDLRDLGGHLTTYSASIASVDTVKMESVTTQLGLLIDEFRSLQGFDSWGVTEFAKTVQDTTSLIGSDFVSGFTTSVEASKNEVNNATESLGSGALSSFKRGAGLLFSPTKTYTSGVNFVQGYANGILGKINLTNNAAIKMGESSVESLANSIHSHSPSDDTEEKGINFGEGFGIGIASMVAYVRGEAQTMGNQAVQGLMAGISGAATSNLGKNIRSKIVTTAFDAIKGGLADMFEPVTSQANEVKENLEDTMAGIVPDMSNIGSGISGALGKGIKENKSPEEAAQEKADAIKKIFEDVVSDIDLNKQIRDAQYNLWENTEGYGASEAEANQRKLQDLSQDAIDAQKRVDAAQEAYRKTAEELGENSKQAREAFLTLTKEQTSMAQLTNQIAELQGKSDKTQTMTMAQQREAYQTYYNYMRDYKDALLKQGLTMADVQMLARKEAGLPDPADQAKDTKNVLKTASKATEVGGQIQESLGGVLESAAGTTQGIYTMASSMTNVGETYTTNLGTGMQQGLPKITKSIDQINATSESKIVSQNETWQNLGTGLTDNLANGITDGTETVVNAATQLGQAAQQAYLNGLNSGDVKGAVPVNTGGLGGVGGGGALMTSPQYIIDYGGSPIRVSRSAYLAYQADRLSGGMFAETSGKSSGTSTPSSSITFNQTINSPKALSSSTIYRQTKSTLNSFALKAMPKVKK